MTATQKNIIELMSKGEPLIKYSRVCYVGSEKVNANSVKSLISKNEIHFLMHDNANDYDIYTIKPTNNE